MRKLIFISILGIFVAFVYGSALAQQGGNQGTGTGQGTGQGGGDQVRAQNPELHDGDTTPGMGQPQGNQVQNQLKVNTQNQGEDTQLKVSTQNQESSKFNEGGRSGVARMHMSKVASEVEKFLDAGNRFGGIGQEVSDIAKQQKQAQSRIGTVLDEMDSRKGIMRALFGADMGAVEEMDKLMEQNRVRVQKLQELMNQVQNEGEETQLKEMVQAMIEQNTALQNQVNTEMQSKVIFGWLLNMFN